MIESIIAMFSTALAGGGVTWLFFFRTRLKREKSSLQKAEFEDVSSIVKQGISDLRELSGRISELEREKVEILEENNRLKTENANLSESLRRYIKANNPRL
jgi:regulator of replication initiation timing